MKNRNFKELLLESYMPDPVKAEISTGNWVRALAAEIKNVHGEDIASWDVSLSAHFTSFQGKDIDFEPEALRCLFHGISLTCSFKRYGELDISPWDIVGQISNFYYTLFNYFSVFVIFQTNRLVGNHTSFQGSYSSLMHKLPHPFNMHTEFTTSRWNGNRLISNEFYDVVFPSLNKIVISPTKGEINNIYDRTVISSVSEDILVGYLRGTTQFRIDRKKERFLGSCKFSNFRYKEPRDQVNPTLKKCGVNFMTMAYRYRTKAHYRDFLYLTMKCSSYGETNNSIKNDVFEDMFFVGKFLCRTTLRFLEQKIGKHDVEVLRQEISNLLKDTEKIEHFWE